jgi:hypothetical protein
VTMHAENCQCEYCQCYARVPWVVLTLRVLCPKCNKVALHTDRIHSGVHWSPSVHCETCGFIDIHDVIVGKIGITAPSEVPQLNGT